ncbi:Dolichyl-diphosphooligosaccharide--protein glycosyltransferase subunit DAD1 [Picochlorum sp. SENEW3]|nr:Dolichyl-diphosphooligosaccharide--protein glycosyltransferase subunit DAD1 [Picochlorum sp. SENEW3]|mmetsp:Transcript_6237/g.12263  ORF Transcript_6237/g.12263 Transcript_6237/m.12263 type:complete len:117 (-) Transcript_6237:43-393(-)|eukprot:jgi/Picre1/32636/NNA_007982.t1
MGQTSRPLGFPLQEIISTFATKYKAVPPRLRVLDIFACCALATAILQFIYSLIVGSFPFNAFLSGVFCCAGTAVLTICLRLQISEGQNSSKTPERAFVDYVLAMSTLFLAVWCYIG